MLVEYTRGKLYLGVIDASGITYSKNTIGSYRKDGNKFKIAFKKSVRENSEGWELEEDKYIYDEKYIIGRVSGILEGKTIVIKGSVDSFWEGIEKGINLYLKIK